MNPGLGQIASLTVFSDGSVVAISRDGKFAHSEGFDKPFTIVKETGATFGTLNFSSYDNGIDRYILAAEYGHTSTMKKIMVIQRWWANILCFKRRGHAVYRQQPLAHCNI